MCVTGFESILEGIYGQRLLQDLSIFVSELFFIYLILRTNRIRQKELYWSNLSAF